MAKETDTYGPTKDWKCGSGKVVLTDPGYGTESLISNSLGGTLDLVPGDWKAQLVYDPTHHRVKMLCAWTVMETKTSEWKLAPFTVGVDTGMCLIIDATHAPASIPDEDNGTDSATFYGQVCGTVETKALVLPNQEGLVCRSGYGDGYYSVFIRETSLGQVSDINVLFITDDILEQVKDDDAFHDDGIERDMIEGPHMLAMFEKLRSEKPSK